MGPDRRSPADLPEPGEWSRPGGVDPATLLAGGSRDLLARRAATTPERTALVDAPTGRRTSYRALDRAVDRRASGLAGLSSPGGRVAVLLPTGLAFARTYFALARLGATVVALDPDRPAADLADQLERAGAALVVCDRDREATATTVAPPGVPVASVEAPGRESVVHPGDPDDRAGRGFDPATVESDTERLVLFTSGTTGRPKGVRLTVGNLVASAAGSARRLGVDPGDRWLVCLPTCHMGGLAPLVRSTLYGTTTVLQETFDADRTAAVVDERSVTGVSLVPTMLGRLLDAGWTPPEGLRFVLLGGAPAPTDLLDRALDAGVPVYPTYGTTETTSQVATATPREAATRPGTVGRPLPGTTVSVVPADGRPDASGSGELVVDGPTVSPGYLDADRTAEAFDDEGFHTGDVGHRDADGYLWVEGRLDERIVTGGENVSPERVVEALCTHERVREAAVVGLPDEEWGERVAALVVADDTDRESLLARARERLAPYEVPKTVAFAESVPRTPSGTVDREAVRAMLDAARE